GTLEKPQCVAAYNKARSCASGRCSYTSRQKRARSYTLRLPYCLEAPLHPWDTFLSPFNEFRLPELLLSHNPMMETYPSLSEA
ncbi:hypothetical protein TorRG33x02_331250, partial [Trema orientale]